MRMASLLIAGAIFLGSMATVEAQVASIGVVRVSTNAEILRGGNIIKAASGQQLQQKDVLVTGPSGAMGVVLDDNSVLSLGPNSRLSLTSFSFAPRENKFGFLANLARGTLEYISGKISKLARDAVKFETPLTTVAVRGTRLLIRVEE